MAKSINRPSNLSSPRLTPLERLWALRVLVRLDAQVKLAESRNAIHLAELSKALGIPELLQANGSQDTIETVLAGQLKAAEAASTKLTPAPILRENLDQLASILKLSPADCAILAFTISLHNESIMEQLTDWLGQPNRRDLRQWLAIILGLPLGQVKASLAPNAVLARTGLLSVSQSRTNDLMSKLNLLSWQLADRIASERCEPFDLLRGVVTATPPPLLVREDYQHLADSLDILVPYLQKSIKTRRRGVNILLHGAPGTGKTQLVRMLAREAQATLFTIEDSDEDGDLICPKGRLGVLRAAQTMLTTSQSMLVFDEVEDIFGTSGWRMESVAKTHKAWINRALEEADVPTFWITNSIGALDAAFIRRFDMVIEVGIPSRAQRLRILKDACGDLASEAFIKRLAEHNQLAPAVVTRASAVARTLRHRSRHNVEPVLAQLIGNTLQAQGHKPPLDCDPNRLPSHYDPSYINADTDLLACVKGLRKHPVGRLCLYGPPGTGKTAFGRWLAAELGLELQVVRASDLLGPFVGMTESNIANAFASAAEDGAVLMIDEVDSFLRDRSQARQSWEATLVNEMLTQVESFPGLLIASTNLMEQLDAATMRRFDAKIRIDYLKKDQAARLLAAQCSAIGLTPPAAEHLASLARIDRLAPGDFAAIARQHRFNPIAEPGEFVARLRDESALKSGAVRRPIGFVH